MTWKRPARIPTSTSSSYSSTPLRIRPARTTEATDKINVALIGVGTQGRELIRAALLDQNKPYDIYDFCRRPLVIRDTSKTIGEVISYLKSIPSDTSAEDGAIDYDAVLIWDDQPRIITGADILGKLLKGIKAPENA